jgi:hypothetical protein
MNMKLHTIFGGLALSALLAVATASAQGNTERASSQPLTETTKHGPVTAQVTVNPGSISLDAHALLTLKITYPSNITVEIPNLDDRAQGFTSGQSFDKTGLDGSGNTVIERVARLTPVVSEKYRIAPIPIVYFRSQDNKSREWFATPAIAIPAENLPAITTEVTDAVDPVWIRPSAKEVGLYGLLAICVVVLIAVLSRLTWQGLRYIKLLRMSPRDRALEELSRLMQRDLVGKDLVKDFYLQLTMIVRLFIERGYKIRAPEQTTDEFLASAEKDPRFDATVLDRLRTFLSSADLVKFAGFKPDRETTNNALTSAKDFIETESAANPETGRKQEVLDA